MHHRTRTKFIHLATTSLLLLLPHTCTSSASTTTRTRNGSTTGSTTEHRRLATTTTTENGFDAFDSDHNGYIDRSEYNVAVSRFQNSLLKGFSASNPAAPGAATDVAAAKDSNAASAQTQDIMSPLINQALSSLNGNNNNNNKSSKSKETLKFWPAFVNSLSMIIATEIGDKTFFIAAVLSMKNDRLAVFCGAVLALIVMTILSSMMGLVLPSILPRKYTHIIGGILFLYFGIKLLIDSRSIAQGKCSDELEEVEEELLQHSSKKDDNDADDEESGGVNNAKSSKKKGKNDATKVFVQALTMTFLAEWGDRSQIATIALAAAKDPLGVNVGGILGHSLCTGMAVIGGRMLAARIEEKTVTKWSGFTFLLFGVHSLFFE